VDEERQRVRDAILKHIGTYPDASDTPEGIRRWWLADASSAATPEVLHAVLEEFVADGVMRRRRLPDGGVVYLSARHQSGQA
jgi:hypothetical protein